MVPVPRSARFQFGLLAIALVSAATGVGIVLDGNQQAARATEPTPAAAPAATLPAEATFSDGERSHWSYLPRQTTPWPAFASGADRAWLRSPIDAWILTGLRAVELEPAAAADRVTLARRLSFDLVGLPPSLEELDEFLGDEQPDAVERFVDRLLASPRYGERWAQHWLDVVRYAETEGFEYDQHRPGAWRYRDYVIESLNADKPFDQFAREQLAGDELASQQMAGNAATPELGQADPRLLTAAGFHRLGPIRRNAGNTDVAFSRNEVLTEMTDAIGAVFLGLTLGCARCHDHKFDAIRQSDYYHLQAFLATTEEFDLPIASADESKRWNDETTRIKDEMKRIREEMQKADGEQRTKLVAQLKQLETELPAPLPTLSTMKRAADRPTAIHLLERGQTDKPGPLVGPRVLGVLLAADTRESPHDLPLPKSRLADWVTAPDHPLTARVLVNRLWHYHFGAGLVATPNDFGVNGAEPSHPELLDMLANSLVVGGWQWKPLHRQLVTSSVYRQSSQASDAMLARANRVDPDNRKLWRFRRRRLDAEQLRDAQLTIAGHLVQKHGGPSVIVPVEKELIDLLYKPSQWEVTANPAEHQRRSVYLIAKRNLRVPSLEVFDQPDLQTSCARRESSTHAPQALEMLNGSFTNAMADRFAQRLAAEAGNDIDRQVELAFRWCAARSPSAAERQLAVDFLRGHAPREFALAMFNLNAFLYVE